MAFRATVKVHSQLSTQPSFGFSGAGFLTCYHLGAAKCLIEKGCFEFQRLAGVSGGALAAVAVAAGVNPEIAMQTALDIAQQTRQQGGLLDVLRPGFSLIDLVEKPLLREILDATGDDVELLLRRIQNGRRLRIGLTNRTITPFVGNPKAHCYVDQYRNAEDIVAAAMLSSYIPGGTGLFSGWSETIVRSSERLREMVALGFVKKEKSDGTITTVILRPSHATGDSHGSTSGMTNDNEMNTTREMDSETIIFLDGGLSNVFPVFDTNTVVVTPLCGIFDPNPSVCPQLGPDLLANGNLIRINHRAQVYQNRQNMYTFRRMALSSDETALQERYANGYDDARRFLSDHNLQSTHSLPAA